MKKIFECEQCGLVFWYVSLYNRHLLVHSKDRQFKCSHCPKKFKRSDTLKTHENIHTGNSKLVCCGKAHNSKAALKYHQRLAHASDSTTVSCGDGVSKKQKQAVSNITMMEKNSSKGLNFMLQPEFCDLVIFSENALSQQVEMDDIQNISTPVREHNSVVGMESMKISLFK